MHLSFEDIARLYGRQIFIVPAQRDHTQATPPTPQPVADTQVAEAPVVHTPEVQTPVVHTLVVQTPVVHTPVVQTPAELPAEPLPVCMRRGGSIDWKMKPAAVVAFVLLADEFADRKLTSLLRELVLAAAIDTDRIGFGVLQAGYSTWDFSTLAVPQAVACCDFPEKLPQPVVWGERRILLAAPLARIATDPRYRKAMERLLLRIKEQL
ncbi:MAG: hypothetical protein OHK0039_37790 [Bacteroidia bacterium]